MEMEMDKFKAWASYFQIGDQDLSILPWPNGFVVVYLC